MKNDELAAPLAVELLGDAPLALAGEGKTLRGYVRVNNPGSEVINLREVILRLQAPGSQRLAVFGHTALALALQPGQTARIKLSFDYDLLIPPGEYPGELELNGVTHKVLAYLAEVVRLVISPATLVIDQVVDAGPRRVVFSNEGNVPLTIGASMPFVLGKELLLRRAGSINLAAAGEKGAAIERLVAEFTREESKALFSDAGTLLARFTAGGFTLQPGEVRAAELSLQLPETLEGGARYIARAPFYTSELELILVPPTAEPVKPPRSRGKAEK
jgi:hypothetical protein